ncbi:hypothetical protein [Longimicrobium sp.]|uniref:hypothetical protein n=1 Tax=Longimicrobium sp. TaxID=2029185 RepID=UPI002C75C762|nr:hypothetical protein [Longimicrobium sp.]HSU13741.1 hypothetical protein [Longimicrobium sp.]
MRTGTILLALLAFAGGCKHQAAPPAEVSPSPATGESREQREALPPPILALIGERARLSLTSEQVVALDSIQQRWSAENARLTQTGMVMSTSVLGTTFKRGTVAPSGPEARANHFRAAKAVEAVLTEQQRRAVCDLHRTRPEPVHRLWPWCGSRPGAIPGA